MGCGDEKLKRPWWISASAVIPVLVVGVLVVVPIYNLVKMIIALPTSGIFSIGVLASLGIILFQTLTIATLTAVGAVLAGLPLSYILARYSVKHRKFIQALVLTPFVLPTVVTGIAIKGLVGSAVSQGLWLILIGHVYVNLAVVVRIVTPVWEAMDQRFIYAARSLGASGWRLTRTIVWPLIRSAVWRAYGIVFVFGASSLGLVLILGDGRWQTFEVAILRQISVLVNFQIAAVFAVLQLLLVLIVLGITSRRRVVARAARHGVHDRKPLTKSVAARVALYVYVIALIIPLLWLVKTSVTLDGSVGFSAWISVLTENEILESISVDNVFMTTLKVAALTAVISMLVGGAAAMTTLGSRLTANLGKTGFVTLGISSVTLGLALLVTVTRPPFEFNRSLWLIAVTHSLVALPLVMAQVQPLLQSVDARLLTAAASLGAHPFAAYKTAYGKVARTSLLSAASVSAAVSLGEFGAASFLGGYDQPTLAVTILRVLSKPSEYSLAFAAALSVMLAAMTLLVSLGFDSVSESEHRKVRHD
jgi:thiamine transport system permease protein